MMAEAHAFVVDKIGPTHLANAVDSHQIDLGSTYTRAVRSIAVMVLVGGGVSTARAEYPIEVADRPLVMHAGMNELALYYSRGHQLVTMADTMGNPVTMRSDFGERTRWVLGYAHSFGRVELIASLSNENGMLGVRVAATDSLVVALRVTGEGGTYAMGGSYYVIGQSLRAGYRVAHVPRRFALHVNGGALLAEGRVRVFDGSFRSGVEVQADVGTYGTVQLARNVSAWAGASAAALVHSTFVDERGGGFNADGGFQLSQRRWDFSAVGGVSDFTDTQRLYVGAQIAFRWGL
jgi:hypothetical protein